MRDAKLLERLNALVYDGEEIDSSTELILIYSWTGGYEKLTITRNDTGDTEYAGSFHPNGTCEGGRVCRWCGSVI